MYLTEIAGGEEEMGIRGYIYVTEIAGGDAEGV